MKNKKVLLILFSIIILIVAIIGILYFETDVFKSEKQLFFESLSKIKMVDSELLERYKALSKKILLNNNSSKSNMNFAISIPDQQTGISQVQNIFGIKTNSLANKTLKQEYRDFTVEMNNKDFMILKAIRDNNTYGIKIDNVLAKYISLENKNLKEFFEKIGIEDTSHIPNSMLNDLQSILETNEEILNIIIQKYYTLIYDNIDDSHFGKVVNEDETQILNVQLNEQELMNIFKLILVNASEDSNILNVITDKAKLLGYETINTVDVQPKIREIAEDINIDEYSQENLLTISLIVDNEKVNKIVLQTNYKGEDNNSVQNNLFANQYTVEFDISKIGKVITSIFENNIEKQKITFEYSWNDENINANLDFNYKNNDDIDNYIRIQYQISNYQTDNTKESGVIYINDGEENNYQIDFLNEISIKQDVQIEKLTTENSAKLNDMTAEELQNLFNAVANRMMSLYGKQIEEVLPQTRLMNEAKEKTKNQEEGTIQEQQN